MFREALGYPTKSPEGGRSIILGGIALACVGLCVGAAALGRPYAYLAPFGLLPWLAVRGYYIRVIRTTIGRTRPVPPRFDGVRRLLADGAAAAGIAVVYLLPSGVVLGPLVVIRLLDGDLDTLFSFGPLPEGTGTVVVPVIGLIAIVALMALLGALYVLPVAVARFAHSGRWLDALELRTVVRGAMTEDYAIAWGVSLVLQALLLPVSYVLRILLVGFFLHFIVAVGVRYCYGQGVGAALDLSPIETGQSDNDARGTTESDTGEPTEAFVRVDTTSWGVGPGEGAEPMVKSVLLDDPEATEIANTDATVDHEDAHADVDTGASEHGREDPGVGADPGWGLPPAVRRVSDDESSPDH